MDRIRWFAAAGGAVLITVLTGAAAGQNAGQSGAASGTTQSASPSSAQAVPVYRTNANLVVLDVVVRDKSKNGGTPVLGLKQSDFHVLENGKEQNVSVFEEHKATEAMQASAPATLPPHVYSDAPQYAITSAANVLLMDSLNTPYSDQVYIRTRMIRDLKAIPDGTQIAVFKLDAKLHVVSGFTSDKEAIAKILDKGPGLPENSPVMDPQFNRAMSQLSGLAAGAGANTLSQQNLTQVANETREFQGNLQGENTMDAFTQMARYLSTIPGRKNLIWYTATIPFSFPTGSTGEADFSGQMQKMLELLAVARVAVYPIDSRGLATRPHDWDHLRMDQMATETGGKAFYNTDAVGTALPEAIANGSEYYTLAYSPIDHNYNGALRNIAVKMGDNENYDLEYRHGYYADDPAKRDQLMAGRTSPLIDAMQHGSLELSQVLFDVRLLPAGDPEVKAEPVTPGPAGLVTKGLKHPKRYMVDYWVDPRGVETKPTPDGGQHREMEVTQVSYDSEGIRENYSDLPLAVNLSAAEAQRALSDGIPLHQEIDLPEGKGYLRVGVHDLLSGRIGTVEIPVDVGK